MQDTTKTECQGSRKEKIKESLKLHDCREVSKLTGYSVNHVRKVLLYNTRENEIVLKVAELLVETRQQFETGLKVILSDGEVANG